MSANTDSKTLKMTNQDKNQSKWKAEAKVSDWTEWVCEPIASKLQALLVSCQIRVRGTASLSYRRQLKEHRGYDWAMLKWTHLLQVLQPLQLQLGLQENKKAQEFNMLLFFFLMNRKTCRKRREKGEDKTGSVFLQKGCCERKRFLRKKKKKKSPIWFIPLSTEYSPFQLWMHSWDTFFW